MYKNEICFIAIWFICPSGCMCTVSLSDLQINSASIFPTELRYDFPNTVNYKIIDWLNIWIKHTNSLYKPCDPNNYRRMQRKKTVVETKVSANELCNEISRLQHIYALAKGIPSEAMWSVFQFAQEEIPILIRNINSSIYREYNGSSDSIEDAVAALIRVYTSIQMEPDHLQSEIDFPIKTIFHDGRKHLSYHIFELRKFLATGEYEQAELVSELLSTRICLIRLGTYSIIDYEKASRSVKHLLHRARKRVEWVPLSILKCQLLTWAEDVLMMEDLSGMQIEDLLNLFPESNSWEQRMIQEETTGLRRLRGLRDKELKPYIEKISLSIAYILEAYEYRYELGNTRELESIYMLIRNLNTKPPFWNCFYTQPFLTLTRNQEEEIAFCKLYFARELAYCRDKIMLIELFARLIGYRILSDGSRIKVGSVCLESAIAECILREEKELKRFPWVNFICGETQLTSSGRIASYNKVYYRNRVTKPLFFAEYCDTFDPELDLGINGYVAALVPNMLGQTLDEIGDIGADPNLSSEVKNRIFLEYSVLEGFFRQRLSQVYSSNSLNLLPLGNHSCEEEDEMTGLKHNMTFYFD